MCTAFDIMILDTPPEVHGGRLPGVLLVTPIDGVDAARNLITMLRLTPPNTDIVLVHFGQTDAEEWAANAEAIEQALQRRVQYLDEPLPRPKRIKKAHNEGRSVWTLPRTGLTLIFLSAVDSIAQMVWERLHLRRTWPMMPPASSSVPYVPGWDDE